MTRTRRRWLLFALLLLPACRLGEVLRPGPADVPELRMPEAPAADADATAPADPPAAKTGPLELSVEEAAVLALSRNRDLTARRLGPVIAGTFEAIERARFDPELFASGTTGKEVSSETSRSTGERYDVQSLSGGVEAGARIDLPTGTSVELGASADRSDSDRTPDQHQTRVGLTVTQALLRGYGPAVNLVDVRQAQLDTLASEAELRGFVESLLADTEIAYWRFRLAKSEIEIFERSLALARRQNDEVAQQVDVGLLPQTETAASRAEIARREQALIEARAELEASRLRLLRLVDEPFGRPAEATSDPAIEPRAVGDLEERLILAERSRPDLAEARLRLERGRLETIVTKNGLLPRLDLFVALGKSGYAESFAQSVRDLGGGSYDFEAGLSLSWFLGEREERARHLAARATRRQAAAAVENLRQLVRLDVRLAANEVDRARRQIEASAATRRLQEETLRAEEERFRVGSSTSLLVARAQRDLLASQIAEIESVVAYRIARVRLYLAEGSLLDRRGVRIGD